jgi:hypothetical protein
VVLVHGASSHAREEALPHARLGDFPQRVRVLVPRVEVADDRDRGGVRRKDGEGGPGDAVDRARMRSEPLPEARMGSLVEEVEVVGAEKRRAIDRRAGARDGTGASFLRQKNPLAAVYPGARRRRFVA